LTPWFVLSFIVNSGIVLSWKRKNFLERKDHSVAIQTWLASVELALNPETSQKSLFVALSYQDDSVRRRR